MLPENYWRMVSTENMLLSHTIFVGFISMFKCSLNAELIEVLTEFLSDHNNGRDHLRE